MSDSIQLYYRNVMRDMVGAEHGLSPAELETLAQPIAGITRKMAEKRLPYRELPYREELREVVHRLSERLSGRFENLVVLGIGGSALGNIALQTALNDPLYNLQPPKGRPRLFVVDNVDPVQFGSLLDFVGDKLDKTCFNVVSKSGKTAETASQFMVVTRLLRERLGAKGLREHVIATTDPESGTLREIADREKLTTLEVPPGVGGRFSVLSHVGLFSAAMCGIDIEALHGGARDMDKRVQGELGQNPAALYAAIQYAFYRKKKNLSVMMPYSYQLKDLCDWYRQLWAESLGKAHDLEGNVVHVGPTPIKALGATDQHSQVQLYREGPNDKVFTFLEVERFSRDVEIPGDGGVADLSYLENQTMGKLLNSEKLGTEYALLQSERPCLTVRFPRVDAHAVGQFIYLFEVATSYMGELLGIDTYDQPAVELGKLATFALMGQAEQRELLAKIEPTSKTDRNYLV